MQTKQPTKDQLDQFVSYAQSLCLGVWLEKERGKLVRVNAMTGNRNQFAVITYHVALHCASASIGWRDYTDDVQAIFTV